MNNQVTIMQTGDQGEDVALLQRNLKRAGYTVEVSHIYDQQTVAAVIALQTSAGLVVDGIAGTKTRTALLGVKQPRHLTQAALIAAAQQLDIPLACIQAVNEVESRGQGFFSSGRPVILFERHVFWQQLSAADIAPDTLAACQQNILSKTPGGYLGGEAEYTRLASAKQINAPAALASCSWGAFQIMGYHWQALGYASIEDFVAQMESGEAAQLDAFVRFIQHDTALLTAIKTRKWAQFAKLYNGPDYARNLYDVKLAQAYAKYSDKPSDSAKAAA